MNSLTITPQAVVRGCRHGRSRAWRGYQSRTRSGSGTAADGATAPRPRRDHPGVRPASGPLLRSAVPERDAPATCGSRVGTLRHMWEPVGPLPASVYRRRRLVAICATLGLLVVAAWSAAA